MEWHKALSRAEAICRKDILHFLQSGNVFFVYTLQIVTLYEKKRNFRMGEMKKRGYTCG